MNPEFATEFGKTPEEMFIAKGWILKKKQDDDGTTDYELVHKDFPRATFMIHDRYDYFYKLGNVNSRFLGGVKEYRKRILHDGSVVYQDYSFFRGKWWMILDALGKVVTEIIADTSQHKDWGWVRDWNYVEPGDLEFCLPRRKEPAISFSQYIQDPPNKYRGNNLYPCRKCGRLHMFVVNPYRMCSNCVRYAVDCEELGLSLEDRCDGWQCECGSPHTRPNTCLPEENRSAEYRKAS
jgi:hypothetical protein